MEMTSIQFCGTPCHILVAYENGWAHTDYTVLIVSPTTYSNHMIWVGTTPNCMYVHQDLCYRRGINSSHWLFCGIPYHILTADAAVGITLALSIFVVFLTT